MTSLTSLSRSSSYVPFKDLVPPLSVNLSIQTPTVILAKLSVITLYQRIFTRSPGWFSITCWTMVVHLILWFIGAYLATFLICQPLETFWTANCVSSPEMSLSVNILDIIRNVVLFILPQPIIWSLQMPFKRRLDVSRLLVLGAL